MRSTIGIFMYSTQVDAMGMVSNFIEIVINSLGSYLFDIYTLVWYNNNVLSTHQKGMF